MASERGELVLARDAIGIKPLYYSVTARTISFGGEIKALLAGADECLASIPKHGIFSSGRAIPGRSATPRQGLSRGLPDRS